MRTRYYGWDLDEYKVALYERNGECLKCGKCCGSEIRLGASDPYGNNTRNGGRTHDGLGLWHEIVRGRWHWFFKVIKVDPECETECGYLEDSLCNDQSKKPRICKEWPFGPKCLESLPECGYSFAKLDEWKVCSHCHSTYRDEDRWEKPEWGVSDEKAIRYPSSE